MEHLEYYLLAALAFSEGLALLPFLKSNSILQFIKELLKFLAKKKKCLK